MKKSSKHSATANLPPIVSPRVTKISPTKPALGICFRSNSQKLSCQLEKEESAPNTNRPATDNIGVLKKTSNIRLQKQVKQVSQSVKDFLIRKKIAQPSQHAAIKYQTPAIRMVFIHDKDEIPNEETIKDEIIIQQDQEKRLLNSKIMSQSSSFQQSSSSSYKQQIGSSSNENEIQSNHSFTEGEFINAGSFGQVFQAQENRSGIIYAVKKIKKTQFEEEDLKELQNEIVLMQKIDHKNIVKYICSNETIDSQLIYLEYVPQGNLNQLIKKYGPLKLETISSYSKQILEALQYLHELRIIHRDVKCANILVDSSGCVKISDFGCSKIKEKTIKMIHSNTSDKNVLSNLKGSLPYMAPEVVQQKELSYSADIWSFGCTLLEMCSGKRPWYEHDFDNILTAILTIGMSDLIPTIPEDLESNVKDMIIKCLQREPLDRPSAQQLLQHQFILQY